MRKVYLIILDGFGVGKHDKGDAIYQAQTPFLDTLWGIPHAELKTHGSCVGLPQGQTGGSEVGHITLGSGRVVRQLLTRINDQINSGEFYENPVLKELFTQAQKTGRIHFMGLCSDGGIHSYLPHLWGLLHMAQQYKIPNIFIHAIADGRDVGERTALQYLAQIQDQGIGTLATVGGRFWGMDRDTNWDRIEAHYKVLCDPDTKPTTQTAQQVIQAHYDQTQKSDYYLPPALLDSNGQIQPDDTVINFDFRTDRMRQISAALCDPNFSKFNTPVHISPSHYGIFGNYFSSAALVFSFSKQAIPNTLGEVVSAQGLSQLRIAETEKFNHVTFFFSGERKEEFPKEHRLLIPSPKCASYAEKPEMSALQMTDAALKEITAQEYSLVVHNYANADLVGHSGDEAAAIQAIQTLDTCLARLVPAVQKLGYDIILTADHGNADEMFLSNGEVSASHSQNLVPCWILPADNTHPKMKPEGTLADVAPTICNLLGLEIPEEMTGKGLLE